MFSVIHFSYGKGGVTEKMLLGVVLILLVTYLLVQEIRNQQILVESSARIVDIQNRLKETNLDTVRSLVLAEEAKDPYTSGHSARVAKYACMIAKELKLTDREVKVLENAGILHDIGKMGISDSILLKKGKLNDKEWEVIKKHPNLSVDIVSPLTFLSREREVIKYHHERYDGKGYPEGIKGEQIPLSARIICVSDAFDAMKSTRPYRPALTKEAIISELKKGRGSQFDPSVVDVLLELMDKYDLI